MLRVMSAWPERHLSSDRVPAVSRPVPEWQRLRDDLTVLHAAALAAADPAAAVLRALRLDGERVHLGDAVFDLRPPARIRLIAFGKASVGMSRAVLGLLGTRITSGIIAHPHQAEDHGPWPAGCVRFAASHPLPDEGSLRAGEAALGMLRDATGEDLVLVLVSGGGSALFESLRPGITLRDLREVTEAMQHAGADIMDLNVVRRGLSVIKGGGLSRAAGPARVVTLVLSDVIGDPLASIASGPTIDSPTGPRHALEVLGRRQLAARFPNVVRVLQEAVSPAPPEHPRGARIARVVGSNRMASEALCAAAESLGFRTLLLTDRMQGEAREVGRMVGGLARGLIESGLPYPVPACIVLGGETTVTVRGGGRGGRNLELALGAALSLESCAHAAVFSFATDGMDGSSGAAGALATGETLARAASLGLSAHRALAESNTGPFFEALGDLWITGASGTNVNDISVVLAYS